MLRGRGSTVHGVDLKKSEFTDAVGSITDPDFVRRQMVGVSARPPVPKNIYGTTKLMAENLCGLFFRERGLPIVILRTSRFFPEDDDDPRCLPETAQTNELLYRRLDIADAVSAHLLAVASAPEIGFARYIISATSPFKPHYLAALGATRLASYANSIQIAHSSIRIAHNSIRRTAGRCSHRSIASTINDRARRELGWHLGLASRIRFRPCSERPSRGTGFSLAREVGSKGYHATAFDDGPYPVAS